ncbi:MAG: stage III sporulation protein AF [Ruminococcus sp.]|nr:stage III sporulation protein AF [Ruminococcus sp.]
MKGLFTVVIVVCAASLICTLVSTFITDGSTKKIINLVLGAFIVCSLISPIISAFSSVDINLSGYATTESIISSNDEAYSNEIIKQTQTNLENSANDILLQNGININSCKIILAKEDENRIIISSISIYISKDNAEHSQSIKEIIKDNFGINPNIMTE